MHDFNKINLYIIVVVPNLEFRLKVESLSMRKLNTIYPHVLNSVFNGNDFNNVDNVCVYSKLNLTKINYNYKKGCRGKKKEMIKLKFLVL